MASLGELKFATNELFKFTGFLQESRFTFSFGVKFKFLGELFEMTII